jgi:dGTPase
MGLNLTFETREGILKHCAVKHAAALGDVGERFLNKTQPTLEAQLTNLADEIAYNNHDIEDGLRSGLITLEQLQDVPVFAVEYQAVLKQYPDLQGRRLIRETLRRLIGCMVVDLIESSRAAINASGVQTLADVRAQPVALMRYSDTMRAQKNVLKTFLRENLYFHPTVYRMTWRAQKIVRALFEAYMADTRLLTPKYQAFAKRYEADDGEVGRARAIADFIAGMTDRYAMREYGQLFDLAAS